MLTVLVALDRSRTSRKRILLGETLMPGSQSRKLVAILAADIAGYSVLMASDEACTVRDLKGHQAVVLPMIGEFGGRIIDTAGDGILAEFASVVGAVDCAVAIQEEMAERNATIEPKRRMQFRIGVNIGDIIYDESRIYGDGINIAARLEGIAEPGGIFISRQAFDQVDGKVALSFRKLGLKNLKNITKPVEVYAVDGIGGSENISRPVRVFHVRLVPRVSRGWIGTTAASALMIIVCVGAYYAGVPLPWSGSPAVVIGPGAGQTTIAESNRSAQEAKAKGEAETARLGNLAAQSKREQEDRQKATAAEIAKLEDDRRQAEAETKRRGDEEGARLDPALSVTPGSGQSFRDRLTDGLPCPMCPEMVVAPAGSFMMGSPPSEPQRDDGEVQVPVTIARAFAVGKFAVTFDEWDACKADGGCEGYHPNDRGWGRGRRPVINVNWDDVKLYIEWLNAKTGKTYRLLSEAKLEYVTRAGTTTPFWWGAAITPKLANYNGSAEPYKGGGAKGEDRRQTVPVDSFEANPWGLFNVHGNVWEWTEDCWNNSNHGNPGNGSARTTGDCSSRVSRGGSWFYSPQFLRAAYRVGTNTNSRFQGLGFRLARTITP
jgi:formylglycine-generating enzyme required for sulfatase activity/class 3 adenylate cyclase